jgi:hypothetical protein
MNSRRCISAPKVSSQHCIGSNEYFDRAQSGITTIAAVHNQCHIWVKSPHYRTATWESALTSNSGR